MGKNSQAHQRLLTVVKSLAREKRDFLEKLKSDVIRLDEPDLIWECLLRGFATMGNVQGWDGLIGNDSNHRRVRFDVLGRLSGENRLSVLEQTLRAAKVRWPAKKARWLARNFELIEAMGGPTKATEILLGKPGRAEKIGFLKSFWGVGDKYARDMLMDAYHPDFRETIAIDSRISSVSEQLNISFHSYEAHERFYLDVAHDAGLDGWELDRLLFNFRDLVLHRLEQTRPLDRVSTEELANIASGTGAEVLHGLLRYPSEGDGWQLGDLDLSQYLEKYRDREIVLIIASMGQAGQVE